MKFLWCTINVKDMEASLKFYQDVIGLKVLRRYRPAAEVEIAFLGEGETQVELIHNTNIQDVKHGSHISLGFETESISQLIQVFKEKGIQVESGPFEPNPKIAFFYIQDPDGVKIQFVENK